MPCRFPFLAAWAHDEAWPIPDRDQATCHIASHLSPFDTFQALPDYAAASFTPLRRPCKYNATAFTGDTPASGGEAKTSNEGDPLASGGEDKKPASLDTMNEAVTSAEAALHRALRSMSDSHALHLRLGDLKAERVSESARIATEKLIRDSVDLHKQLKAIDDDDLALSKAMKNHGDVGGAVKALSDDLDQATATIDDMEKYIHRFYRRAWALTDIYNAASAQPDIEDMTEPPRNPNTEDGGEAEEEGLRTAAGCVCDPKSKCAEHGYPFKWCVVKPPNNKGVQCPLYWDTSARDAAGNDHRLTGAGTPYPMWDYCRMGKGNPNDEKPVEQDPTIPAFAHRGCKCAFRGDLLGKYGNNPSFRDKAGKFDWAQVPWSDRLALEAMTVSQLRNSLAKNPSGGVGGAEKNQDHICLRTPSSGSLHVCPAVNANDDQDFPAKLGDPGWCGSHAWDFCVPSQLDNRGEEESALTAEAGATQQGIGDINLGLIASLAWKGWQASAREARSRPRRRAGLNFL